ncbi:MAG: type II CAAX endopeptidase family protein [Caldilineaceae bacterium]
MPTKRSKATWLAAPFWNRQERRIRACWRVAIQLACYLIAQLSPTYLIGDRHDSNSLIWVGPVPFTHQSVFIFLGMLAILITTWIIGVLIDRRPFSQFGFQMGRQWWLDLLAGLLLGSLLMTLIFLVEWSLGWVEVTGVFQVHRIGIPFAAALLSPLLLFTAVAIQEELLARGYQIRNLAEGLHFAPINERVAILFGSLLSSGLFSWLHLNNPNVSWTSTFTIGLAGFFLSVGYILSGRLGVSIGLHFTWNLFQGTVFSFPVSGNKFDQVSVIAIKQGGPTLWTGGAFGPEAGLLGVIAMILGSLLIVWWIYQQEYHVALYRPLANYDSHRSIVEQKLRQHA